MNFSGASEHDSEDVAQPFQAHIDISIEAACLLRIDVNRPN